MNYNMTDTSYQIKNEFVRVAPNGRQFECAGSPWIFSGCNCYYTLTRAAEAQTRHMVLDLLSSATRLGLSVLRMWVFNDGDGWNSLQTKPELQFTINVNAGIYEEKIFQGLDWIICEAHKHGIKLLFVLVNHWDSYGGMPQYVKWSQQDQGKCIKETCTSEQFYTDSHCQYFYRLFLKTIITRKNSLNHTQYRNDPTIMAWSLANEPRCDGDLTGNIFQKWVESTSQYVKSLDPNHLVTIGCEGFFGASTKDLLSKNPYDALSAGVDFYRNHSCACIDFCTIHLWPDNWLPHASKEAKEEFVKHWICSHADVCEHLKKPLVVSEFGKNAQGEVKRQFYRKVHEILHYEFSQVRLAGTLFWMAATCDYPDYDGTTVYISPPVSDPEKYKENNLVLEEIQLFANAINLLKNQFK